MCVEFSVESSFLALCQGARYRLYINTMPVIFQPLERADPCRVLRASQYSCFVATPRSNKKSTATMTEETNMFAMPPPEDAPEEDAPVLLGQAGDEYPAFAAPEETDFAAPPMGDDYAPPQDDYIGQVDETAMPAEDEPIIMGGPPETSVDDMAAAIIAPPPETEEPSGPTPMQIWNEQWQETLLARKDEENAKKAEFVEASRQEMETFLAQREQKREQRMAKNREDEQEKLEAIEADLENDNSWQRVCKMVDLSHDAKQDSVDVSRMRDTLIFLKNDTTKAVELGA